MNRSLLATILAIAMMCFSITAYAEEATKPEETAKAPAPVSDVETKALESVKAEYSVGIDDVMDIAVLQPEKISVTVTVSPDGAITFPYIGNVQVKGMTLGKVQEEIQARLADGYMKYPVVAVSLRESRSRKFFVYGEVMKPGTYQLEENTTVLRAISMAGGFNKFGSSSRVKILRPRKGSTGYENIKINIKAVMDGSSSDDIMLNPGDIIVVSEGVF